MAVSHQNTGGTARAWFGVRRKEVANNSTARLIAMALSLYTDIQGG